MFFERINQFEDCVRVLYIILFPYFYCSSNKIEKKTDKSEWFTFMLRQVNFFGVTRKKTRNSF